MSELLMPPYPNGSVQQQLTQQYSYLFQMAQQLNMALSALQGGGVSAAGSGSAQQRKSGGAAAAAGKAALENAEQFQNLRAMIVKTAKQVSRNMEQLRHGSARSTWPPPSSAPTCSGSAPIWRPIRRR